MKIYLRFKNILRVLIPCLSLFFAQNGFAQFSVTAGSTNYTQNFNTLTTGTWTNNTTLSGWYTKTDATASITSYAANTGNTTTAGLYAFGVAGTNPSSDRALGYATSNAFTGTAGSGKNYIGWRLRNNTGSAVTSVTVTWTGEQWSKDNTVSQSLYLFYQIAGTVTNLTAGTWLTASSTFTSPVNTSGTTALDGNAAANRTAVITATLMVNIPAGEEIMLRWEDLNDAANDHMLAIDDVTVKVVAAPANVAPTASNVTFTGTLAEGQTLTSTYTYSDADGDAVGTTTYRWFRGDDAVGTGDAVISGATGASYVLTANDAGKFIYVAVTPVASAGVSPGMVAASIRQGPVAASKSTISVSPGFVPVNNVNYALYTGADVTASSFQIARFNVNDIGAPLQDGLPTIVNNLTLSISSFANIEKIAIYDNANIELQELAAAATVNFTGLNILAASGSNTAFSVRLTFKTTVTDNQQPQITVISASVAGQSSFFAALNAGGASSSVSGNNNRIEVTATALDFLQQPVNYAVGENMVPAVKVRAVDVNNNTDLDFTFTTFPNFTPVVTISSTGTLATAQAEMASEGVAAFSTIKHTGQQSGVTLTATANGLAPAVSNPFDIIVQQAGVLVFEENFDFTGALSNNGYTTTSDPGVNSINSSTRRLSLANYGSTGIGNGATLLTNGQDVAKTYASQLTSTPIYASMLIYVMLPGTGDFFFSFGSGAFGNATYRGRLFIRKAAVAGNINVGVSNMGTAATAVYGTTNYPVNTTLHVVLKYQVIGSNAVVSAFVNPGLYTEPGTPEVTTSQNSGLVPSTTYFLLRQGADGLATMMGIDGLRIATNWGTAMGNPQYAANASIVAGNYNSVSVIEGTLIPTASPGVLTINNALNVASGANFILPNNTNLLQKGNININSGAITVKRDAVMRRLDYVYWGCPVNGQKLKTFSEETLNNRFYKHIESTNAFAVVDPLTTGFEGAQGYMIRSPNTFPPNNIDTATFNGSFYGVPNNGNISIDVTKSAENRGFNMIGNPYPSTINAAYFLDANPTLEAIYFWTHASAGNTSGGANYATFNRAGEVTPTTGQYLPNGTIQIGQGFLVRTSANATVNFTNALRVNNTSGQFYRGLANEKNRIWLNLSAGNTPLNQMMAGYITDATNDIDGQFDAAMIDLTGSRLYSIVNNAEFVIQARALPFSNEDVVALGFKAATSGNYTISLDHADGLFSNGQEIFIKDNQTGITHSISDSDYSFASEAGTFNDRFSIVYQVTLRVENPIADTNKIVVFNQNGTLTINSGAIAMQTVKIFDIRGRLLFERDNVNANTTLISGLASTKQMVLIQVTANNNVVNKKSIF